LSGIDFKRDLEKKKKRTDALTEVPDITRGEGDRWITTKSLIWVRKGKNYESGREPERGPSKQATKWIERDL